MIKPLGSAKISNSTEAEVEGNIRELVRDNATFRQAENCDGEIATSSLTTLLGRVSGNSTYELTILLESCRFYARDSKQMVIAFDVTSNNMPRLANR
jgi:hypothetical protein